MLSFYFSSNKVGNFNVHFKMVLGENENLVCFGQNLTKDGNQGNNTGPGNGISKNARESIPEADSTTI